MNKIETEKIMKDVRNEDYESRYCRFIIIRWIPHFVVFSGTGEPRIQTLNGLHISISYVCRHLQFREIKYPRTCWFFQSTKFYSHKNELINSSYIICKTNESG